MRDFYINICEEAFYPSSDEFYNPDTPYPEYIWRDTAISKSRNWVYEMIRNCFIGLKMDFININKREWNPLGEIINRGDTVVIKPNWVMHRNKNKKTIPYSLECLITHPSVVRAVTDYCMIALNGTGKIIIGDAPMQGCDLDRLIAISGYKEMFDFYNQNSINLYPEDFRYYSTVVDDHKVLIGRKYNSGEGINIDLGTNSRFHENGTSNIKRYKVSDYNGKITNEFHNGAKHSYFINKKVLSSDVVINLCKPKSHRLAGITGAIKNFVGITYDKACLPHRIIGSAENGGDEYLYKSNIKKLIGKILDKKIFFEEKNSPRLSLIMRYTYGGLFYLMRSFSKDKFLLGSWYGNDTVWRMALDLYEILLFADKEGNMRDQTQRRVFNIADMIISGERNGPVSPDPKKLGIILAGHDAVSMDKLVCKLMGFDFEKVPSVSKAVSDKKIYKDIGFQFFSNIHEYNAKGLGDLNFPLDWRFKPYDTWQGFIEID